jgi:hypothetical protein
LKWSGGIWARYGRREGGLFALDMRGIGDWNARSIDFSLKYFYASKFQA